MANFKQRLDFLNHLMKKALVALSLLRANTLYWVIITIIRMGFTEFLMVIYNLTGLTIQALLQGNPGCWDSSILMKQHGLKKHFGAMVLIHISLPAARGK